MKTVLLISNKVLHYRVSVYNYLNRRFREDGWEFEVASNAIQAENRQKLQFKFHDLEFNFSAYRQLIETIKPDAVIFHLHLKYKIFWLLLHWLKFKRIPIVNWTKGANLDKPPGGLRDEMFNYVHSLSDALILYSAQQTNRIKPRNRHKIFAANNTVNFEDYPQVRESREEIKAEFGIQFEKLVLFVGTMGIEGERKKVDHLIEIFRQLDRTDVGLVLVGGGMNKDRKARLNPKNTLYLGQIHDEQNLRISKLFKAADLFVVPGHIGLGLNQAFYWGLPAVTEDCHQPPEIQYLKQGRNGFIVPENDLAALQKKIFYLLDNDSVRAEFSKQAREDILTDASIEGMFLGFRHAIEFACRTKGLPQRACGEVNPAAN